jgi:hypothetical protein
MVLVKSGRILSKMWNTIDMNSKIMFIVVFN